MRLIDVDAKELNRRININFVREYHPVSHWMPLPEPPKTDGGKNND